MKGVWKSSPLTPQGSGLAFDALQYFYRMCHHIVHVVQSVRKEQTWGLFVERALHEMYPEYKKCTSPCMSVDGWLSHDSWVLNESILLLTYVCMEGIFTIRNYYNEYYNYCNYLLTVNAYFLVINIHLASLCHHLNNGSTHTQDTFLKLHQHTRSVTSRLSSSLEGSLSSSIGLVSSTKSRQRKGWKGWGN